MYCECLGWSRMQQQDRSLLKENLSWHPHSISTTELPSTNTDLHSSEKRVDSRNLDFLKCYLVSLDDYVALYTHECHQPNTRWRVKCLFSEAQFFTLLQVFNVLMPKPVSQVVPALLVNIECVSTKTVILIVHTCFFLHSAHTTCMVDLKFLMCSAVSRCSHITLLKADVHIFRPVLWCHAHYFNDMFWCGLHQGSSICRAQGQLETYDYVTVIFYQVQLIMSVIHSSKFFNYLTC